MANDFSSNPFILDSPDLIAPTQAAPSQGAGGAFAAGDAFWVLTATNADGESVQSNEVTMTMVLNNKATLNWTQLQGATGYKLYRSLVTGVYGATSLVNVAIGAVSTIDDPGNALIAGTPPLVAYSLAVPTQGARILISKLKWKCGTGGIAGDNLSLRDAAGKEKWASFHTVTAATTSEEDVESDFWPPLESKGLKLVTISRGKLYVHLVGR
jgi:hypothetical protein